ncbi:MAG: methyl-accepting chemotaxis protein [Desulfonauticus sp.]|nr:methyl-accepting chemotaxis protein [Desulfonauticus sp.]
MVKFINNHLNIKLLFLISAVSILIFGILIAFIISKEKKSILRQIHSSLLQQSELIKIAIEKPMIIGDDEGTKDAFKNLAKRINNTVIYLTDFRGNITYSTDFKVIRKYFQHLYSQHKNLHNLISNSKYVTNFVTEINGKHIFLNHRIIKNRPSCYHCHGSSHNILGHLIIMKDITNNISNIREQLYNTAIISIIGVILLISICYQTIKRTIILPIKKISKALKEIAQGEGDLTARIKVYTNDEIGNLAKYFNEFVDNLQNIIKNVVSKSQDVNSASKELSKFSNQIYVETKEMSNKFNKVSHVSSEVSENMNSIAASMEQASTNISLIATASQQMSKSINQIVDKTGKSKKITSKAVLQVDNASEEIKKLGNSAQEITTYN